MGVYKYFFQAKTILNKKNKIFYLFIIILVMVASILEAAGLGLIFPIITIVTQNSDSVENLKIFNFLFTTTNKELLLNNFLFLFILFFFLKTIITLLIIFFKNYLLNYIVFDLNKKIISSYMYSPMRTFKINPGEIIKNLNNEIIFFRKFLDSTTNLIIEIFIVFFILIVLYLFSPIKILLNGIFLGVLGYLIYFFSSNFFNKWGREKSINLGEKMQSILNIINNIKEIKIYKSESFFLHNFIKNTKSLFYIETKESSVSQSIRPIIELAMIYIFFLFFSVEFKSIGENTDLIALLGLYFASAFRAIPSLNRILISIQGIQYTKKSLEIIYKEILNLKKNNLISDKTKKPIVFNNNLEISNFDFSYDKKIFEKSNFIIKKNETVGIFGDSGSGKSTLVDIILGFKKLSKGYIAIDKKIINFKNYFWSGNIGYVGQKISLFNGSLQENITFKKILTNKEKIKVKNLLDTCQLSTNDGFKLGMKIQESGKNLSFGQIQRIGLARSLYGDPKILILDEPTSSLDKDTEIKFINALAKITKNITTIIISHNTYPMSICDRRYKIQKNKTIEFYD